MISGSTELYTSLNYTTLHYTIDFHALHSHITPYASPYLYGLLGLDYMSLKFLFLSCQRRDYFVELYSVQCGTFLIVSNNSNRVAISRLHGSHVYRILYHYEQLNEEKKGTRVAPLSITISQVESDQVSSGKWALMKSPHLILVRTLR